MAEVITPLAYEQFPFQESVFSEMARVSALLGPRAGRITWDWSVVLGLPLDNAVRAAMVLHAWAVNNGGKYDPSILDLPHFQDVFDRIAPRREIELLAKRFTTTVVDARENFESSVAGDSLRRKYALNPLGSKPLVDLGQLGIWAPVAAMIPRALSVANLYYLAAEAWGAEFTNDLGLRTEEYVGEQLGLVSGVQLHPEIVYKIGKNERKSVDWIWVHKEAVVLIESKSARLSRPGHTDSQAMAKSTSQYLVSARRQIDVTAGLIRGRAAGFAHLPVDRPIIGVVLTSEPFYLGNSTLPEYGAKSETPSIVVSLRELEQLVCYPADLSVPHLVRLANGTGGLTWSVSNTFKDFPEPSRNAILDAAFRRYDFAASEL